MLNIEYRTIEVKDLRVLTRRHEGGPERPAAIDAGGDLLQPTERFWRSLFQRYGLTRQVFRYFTYGEVFERVVAANRDDRIRLCIERRAPDANADASQALTTGRLMAVSNPRRPMLTYNQTMELVGRYGDSAPTCRGGVVTSRHVPRSGEAGFHIGPDLFRNRFVVEVPIDGYGQPRIYLSLLRQVCSNGAVGYSRAFRSDIRIGEDAVYTVERAMAQFDHDEGFTALRQRFDSAQKSWASVHETLRLQKTLCRIAPIVSGPAPSLASELNRVAGDLNSLYGMANLESLSVKRQRVLPAKCRVYDLLNFASEVATHRANAEPQMRLQAYIGTLVSDEYDLEGTAEKAPEFADLFLNLN